MSRYLPWFHMRPHPTVGLWVSQLDGSNMHKIGHMTPMVPKGALNASLETSYIRWLPGVKKLSFVYDDTLWTVPSD